MIAGKWQLLAAETYPREFRGKGSVDVEQVGAAAANRRVADDSVVPETAADFVVTNATEQQVGAGAALDMKRRQRRSASLKSLKLKPGEKAGQHIDV